MKDNNIFTRQAAAKTVLATIAGACLAPPGYSASPPSITLPPKISAAIENMSFTKVNASEMVHGDFTVKIQIDNRKWTNSLEKQFRKLALAELKGTLDISQESTLEKLNQLRDTLCNPMPVNDVVLQLKRDRVLNKMSEALKEYFEFKEITSQKRFAS